MNSQIARRYVPFVLIIISFYVGVVNGTSITLVGRNPALSFDDAEPLFGPEITEARGMLHVAKPLDACTPLKNHLVNSSRFNFALIIRGGCSFQKKVRRAQAAGFDLAIVYNYKYSDLFFSTEGDDKDIKITAIFISHESGETLVEYASHTGIGIRITGNDDSVHAFSLMAEVKNFLALYLALLTVGGLLIDMLRCVLVLLPTEPPRPELPTYVQPPTRMHRNSVNAMPCVVYSPVMDPNRTDTTCVICLEDFTRGENLRLLPCNHRFHKECIDPWLTMQRSFCPICKHDARKERQYPPISVSNPVFARPLPPIIVISANA